VSWRAGAVAELAETVEPALPRRALFAAVAADDGGYAVRISDDCPLDGRFEVGSVTKTMTGTVLAALADEGTVKLGDRIGRWLDAGRNSGIKLIHLATHTSGLPRLAPSHVTGAADPYAYLTPEVAERELRLAPFRQPGADWEYSNFGYQVLGLALERAAGTSLRELLDKFLFTPLGMTCSGVVGQGGGCQVQGRAQGRRVTPWTRHLWGAGGVEASAEDMARYVAACLRPPDSPCGQAIREAQRAHYQIDPMRSSGLGWAIGPPGYLGHDGGTSGFRAMLGLRSAARRGAAVFVSDRRASGLPTAVRRALDEG
jgi:CubicO group peptidase (beta-lactamase class C family)